MIKILPFIYFMNIISSNYIIFTDDNSNKNYKKNSKNNFHHYINSSVQIEDVMTLFNTTNVIDLNEFKTHDLKFENYKNKNYKNKNYKNNTDDVCEIYNDNYSFKDLWNLDIINQKEKDIDKIRGTNIGNGKGIVTVVIDTGVNDHSEFKYTKRFECKRLLIDYFNPQELCVTVNNNTINDIIGHGTHVTGTILGKNTGIAHGSELYVFSVDKNQCNTNSLPYLNSALMHLVFLSNNNPTTKYVINLSLGYSTAVNDRLLNIYSYYLKLILNNALYPDNLLIVKSAGNSNDDARNYPINYFCRYYINNCIIVGAININSEKSWYSNYGDTVNIYAPGGDDTTDTMILSSSNFGKNYYVHLQGTSMAAPLVTGVAAVLWQLNPDFTSEELKKYIINTGKIHNHRKILYIDYDYNADNSNIITITLTYYIIIISLYFVIF
jgi:subtilisin family serine protease